MTWCYSVCRVGMSRDLAILWQGGVTVSLGSYSKGHIVFIEGVEQVGFRLGRNGSGLWIVGGDFNEILRTSEYWGRRFRPMSQMRKFGEALDDGLKVVNYTGYKFTWTNRWQGEGNVKLWLDMIVAKDETLLALPDMCTHYINSFVHDHLPIYFSLE
ncbi:unnamed protein product [Prunus armeniaca]|uniref:Endonuclease/exonuclease/phosphatase domain-containing protein n=1 Tax=Prunus armeniaca TaxID=36596 RepID=A0A6J5Y1X6_PRUAR|nr:unnamed protein product [Prunus armeniaca]